MPPHDRRASDITEPQTDGELLRALYRNQQDVVIPAVADIKKTLYGNGKPGICEVVTRHDQTMKTVLWIVGVGVPAAGVVAVWCAWIVAHIPKAGS
jgi:hypothetical protein